MRDKQKSARRRVRRLLQKPCKVDAQTQTSPPVRDAEGVQSSLCPSTPTFFYLPVESGATWPYDRKLLEGNDGCARFYSGLKSWSIFNHLAMYLCTAYVRTIEAFSI